MKGADGQLLVDKREVRERWAEYFKELLNVADEREAVIVAVGDAKRVQAVLYLRYICVHVEIA